MSKIVPKHGLAALKGKSNCYFCKKSFGLLKAEYTCKRCYKSVCDKCSPDSIPTISILGIIQTRRVCLQCRKQATISKSIVSNSQLQFGSDSEKSRDWLSRVNSQRASWLQLKDRYLNLLHSSKANSKTAILKSKRKDIGRELLQGLNFSLRHFVYYTCMVWDPEELANKAVNCVIALLNSNQNLQLSGYMLLMAVILLCYASQTVAFYLLQWAVKRLQQNSVLVRALAIAQVFDPKVADAVLKNSKSIKVVVKYLSINSAKIQFTLSFLDHVFATLQEHVSASAALVYLVAKHYISKEVKQHCQLVYALKQSSLKQTIQKIKNYQPSSPVRNYPSSFEKSQFNSMSTLSKEQRFSDQPFSPSLMTLKCIEEQDELERMRRIVDQQTAFFKNDLTKLKNKLRSLQKIQAQLKDQYQRELQSLKEQRQKQRRNNNLLLIKRDQLASPQLAQDPQEFLHLISLLNTQNREYLSEIEQLRKSVRQEQQQQARLEQQWEKESKSLRGQLKQQREVNEDFE